MQERLDQGLSNRIGGSEKILVEHGDQLISSEANETCFRQIGGEQFRAVMVNSSIIRKTSQSIWQKIRT